MKKTRLLISAIICIVLVIGLTACGSKTSDSDKDNSTKNTEKTLQSAEKTTENNESKASDDTKQDKTETDKNDANTDTNSAESSGENKSGSGKDTLVVVFSATGTTKAVAERIAEMENADFYEITAAEPYTSDDLDYNDSKSRTTKEQNDSKARPEISSETLNLSGYKTIYIGYPIWWGEEPRIMDTFVESYDFGDITMIPFCTSGGSGVGRSDKNLAGNAGSGNWKSGERLKSSISDGDLQDWIDSYK